MAELLAPPYGVMESGCGADSKWIFISIYISE